MKEAKNLNELYAPHTANELRVYHDPEDGMSFQVRKLYEGFCKAHENTAFRPYGAELRSETGLAFCILFDDNYVSDLKATNPFLQGVTRELFNKEFGGTLKCVADSLADRLPLAQVYLGIGSCLDGDEIFVFIPADASGDLFERVANYMDECEEVYHEFEGLLTDRLTYKGKTVGLSIKTLYEKYGNALLGGGDCRVKVIADGGDDYYDLCHVDGGIICCDGEEAEVVDVDAKFVHFIDRDGEDDAEFRLTREEFGVAHYTDTDDSENITYADLSAAADVLFKAEDGPHKKVAHLLLKFVEKRDITYGGEFADIIDRNSAEYLVTSVVDRTAIKTRLVNHGYVATDANVDSAISHMDLGVMRMSLAAKIDVAIFAAADAGDLTDNT